MNVKIVTVTFIAFAALVVSGQSKELLIKKELESFGKTDLCEGGLPFVGPVRMAFGDLTGDGVDEVVALYRWAGGRIRDDIGVFEIKDSKAIVHSRLNTSLEGGYVLSIASFNSNFEIKDGTLVIDQAVLREGDYVPTQYQTVRYKLENGRLTEVERSKRKPLEDHMRETG